MKKIIIILSLFLLSTSCSKLNVFGLISIKTGVAPISTTNNLKEGNITTGWIISENNKERFRISIYILGSERIGDNIKIFSEKEFNKNGEWQRQQVSDAFNTKLKMKIIKDAQSLAL